MEGDQLHSVWILEMEMVDAMSSRSRWGIFWNRELEMDFVIVDLSSLLLFVTVFTVN